MAMRASLRWAFAHDAVGENDHVRTRVVVRRLGGRLGGWRGGAPTGPLTLAASVRRVSIFVPQRHGLVVAAPKIAGEEIANAERGGEWHLVDHGKRLLSIAGT